MVNTVVSFPATDPSVPGPASIPGPGPGPPASFPGVPGSPGLPESVPGAGFPGVPPLSGWSPTMAGLAEAQANSSDATSIDPVARSNFILFTALCQGYGYFTGGGATTDTIVVTPAPAILSFG